MTEKKGPSATVPPGYMVVGFKHATFVAQEPRWGIDGLAGRLRLAVYAHGGDEKVILIRTPGMEVYRGQEVIRRLAALQVRRDGAK